MPTATRHTQLRPGLHRFEDTCNVYVVVRGDRAYAIDFGSGAWMKRAAALKLPKISDVLLTHHHRDQCEGLQRVASRNFAVHAPAGEERFLDPDRVMQFWNTRRNSGNPASYDVVDRGIDAISYDMGGFADVFFGTERVRFLHTPGHGPNALTVLIDHHGEQIAFCGDAAHAGATIHQPYHLEWDHWTGSGALAAWEGVQRLANVRIDVLLPSHGPAITSARRTLLTLCDKLLAFYSAKGNICPDEPDHYVVPTVNAGAWRQLLPNLYQFGVNGYLLRANDNSALIVDPYLGDTESLDALLAALPSVTITACTATHYHFDHLDAAPLLRERYGATFFLHPRVAAPLKKLGDIDAPWLTKTALRGDRAMPMRGKWRWNQYTFDVAPFGGQTWWHACFMTVVDGTKVFFGGDNFQPNSRWNGTGGFSSFNGSRFREGFEASAKLVQDWKPDLIMNGHNTYQRFHASQFRKIAAWSRRAEAAVKALCPSGDLERDYYLHRAR